MQKENEKNSNRTIEVTESEPEPCVPLRWLSLLRQTRMRKHLFVMAHSLRLIFA